jgi:hypothetical protein
MCVLPFVICRLCFWRGGAKVSYAFCAPSTMEHPCQMLLGYRSRIDSIAAATETSPSPNVQVRLPTAALTMVPIPAPVDATAVHTTFLGIGNLLIGSSASHQTC